MIDKQSGGSFLFILVFFAVGIGMTVWGGIVIRNASISEGWPSTQGEITSSYIRSSTDEDGTSYFADIEFKYVVNDRWLEGDMVNFGEYGTSDMSHAEGIVDRYPIGKMVTVYYNPEQPETAVLEPGLTWSSYFILFMGIIFLIVPAIIFASLLRQATIFR